MNEDSRAAQTETISRVISNTVAAYGPRLVPGSAEIAGKMLSDRCLGRNLDDVPGLVAAWLETDPVGQRLANPEFDGKAESAIKTAARAHGVAESKIPAFIARYSASAAFAEGTKAVFDHVATVLDKDDVADAYLESPPTDPRVQKARAILEEFRDHLAGDLDEMARGPFKDLGAMSQEAAYQVMFVRLTSVPHFYREYSIGGKPAEIEGSQIIPDPKRGLAEIRDQLGEDFASRYTHLIS